MIGEFAAGVLLGPSLLGWVEPSSIIRLLAEIGIILSLFEVGLETDVPRLIRTGFKPLVVATAGVNLTFTFGFKAASWLFWSEPAHSASYRRHAGRDQFGITMRVLADLGRSQSHESNIVLGAAVHG